MRKSVLTALVWLLPVVALAQAKPPAPLPPEPPTQEGNAEFAFVNTTGNAQTMTLGLAGGYIYRYDLWTFRGDAAYVRNEVETEVSAESFRSVIRAERQFRPRISFFGQWSYLHDNFAGIRHRNAITAGASYQLFAQEPHDLRVEGGVGYVKEMRKKGDDVSAALGMAGAHYKLKLTEVAEFTDDSSIELMFSDFDGWRWDNVAAITAKLTDVLSLKVSNTIRYVNSPVEGYNTTDTITAVSLVAKF